MFGIQTLVTVAFSPHEPVVDFLNFGLADPFAVAVIVFFPYQCDQILDYVLSFAATPDVVDVICHLAGDLADYVLGDLVSEIIHIHPDVLWCAHSACFNTNQAFCRS